MRKLFDLVGKITVEGIEGLQKNLQAINKSAESVVKPIAKMGNQLSRLGTQMSRNLTVPLAAAGVVMYKGVEAASDLAETVSKVGQIFGDSADEIDKWSNTTAKSIGQSKQQAMDAASTFAVFGKSAGKTGDELSDFSITFANLASDLASFFNTKPEDAITAIGAAFRGENEPIRRYGVLLDDAAMRHKALELGIVSTIKNALTPQQKVLAAQALILEQTKDAQGDFAKTQYGLANQTRIWKAEVADLTAKLGKSFLPIALDVTTIFREKLLPTIEKIVNWWNDLPKGVQETVVKFGAFVAIAGPAILLLGQIVSSVTMITTALKTAQVALMAFNVTMMANPFGLVVIGVAAATAAVIGLVNEYKNLQREHQKYTLMTVDQAKKKEYVKSYDEIVSKVREYGDVLKDETQFNQLLGKSIDDLTKKAEELGYVITGNNEQRLQALNTISLELQGVRDTNGQVITYTKSVEKNTEVKDKNRQKTWEQIEAEQKLADKQKRIAEQRRDFEMDWSDKVLNQSGDRIAILNSEKKDALDIAKGLNAETLNIYKYFDQERLKIFDENIEEFQNKNREAALQEVNTYWETIERKRELEKSLAEEKERLDNEEKARRENLKNTILGGVYQLFDVFSMFSANRETQIDNELKKNIDSINASKLSAEEKERAISDAEKQSDKKKRDLMRKQSISEKASAIFSIGISTAQAIVKALAQLGPIAGVVASFTVGALGAAQAALVAAKPIPLEKGGLAKATNGGINATIAEGDQDELVLPLKTGAKMLVDEFLQRLSQVTLPDPRQSNIKSVNVGDNNTNSSLANRQIIVQAGVIIADDFGLKTLAQRLNKFIISENQRIAVA
ncbi:MAG: hypothetical protein JW915_23655 [Chitinispirillaceae bacterium]|nr:hypothetical protein [Chitinispirillaceae bacterium]